MAARVWLVAMGGAAPRLRPPPEYFGQAEEARE